MWRLFLLLIGLMYVLHRFSLMPFCPFCFLRSFFAGVCIGFGKAMMRKAGYTEAEIADFMADSVQRVAKAKGMD
jgi:hypothetical protein